MNCAGRLDLPSDIVAGVPRLELVGFREFSVEPHGGLLEYEKEQICISSTMGNICVFGNNLTIKLMNRERISVCGEILGIQLQENMR